MAGFPARRAEAVTIVTGGASGIGRALAMKLSADGRDTVYVVDRDVELALSVAREAGSSALAVGLDVSDRDALAAFVSDVEHESGPISRYFSNAGVNRGDGLGAPKDWHASLGVNLMAHVNAADLVVRRMEARGRGVFVITASAAGLLTDLRSAPYSASKHAAVGLAEWLAVCAAEGVSVHCVCPEGVLTGMTQPDSARSAKDIAFLEADDVADIILTNVADGRFLILTHPNTSEYEQRRAGDRQRWIGGMRRARRNALTKEQIFTADVGA